MTPAEVLRAGDTVDARPVTDQTKWEVLLHCKLAKGEFDKPQFPALPRQ